MIINADVAQSGTALVLKTKIGNSSREPVSERISRFKSGRRRIFSFIKKSKAR